MRQTKQKKTTPCPHQAIAFEGGGNWGWAYYDSFQKAKEVSEWIESGVNTKFACQGRHDGVSEDKHTALKDGRKVWCVHYHYDNTNNPTFANPCPNIRTIWA